MVLTSSSSFLTRFQSNPDALTHSNQTERSNSPPGPPVRTRHLKNNPLRVTERVFVNRLPETSPSVWAISRLPDSFGHFAEQRRWPVNAKRNNSISNPDLSCENPTFSSPFRTRQ